MPWHKECVGTEVIWCCHVVQAHVSLQSRISLPSPKPFSLSNRIVADFSSPAPLPSPDIAPSAICLRRRKFFSFFLELPIPLYCCCLLCKKKIFFLLNYATKLNLIHKHSCHRCIRQALLPKKPSLPPPLGESNVHDGNF